MFQAEGCADLKSYWEKSLLDGTTELGRDQDIKVGQASWTRGRQDIVAAKLWVAPWTVLLICPPKEGKISSWKQEDYMIASVQQGQSTRVARSIACNSLGYKKLFVRRGADRRMFYSLGDTSLDESCETYDIPPDTSLVRIVAKPEVTMPVVIFER